MRHTERIAHFDQQPGGLLRPVSNRKNPLPLSNGTASPHISAGWSG
jgi:hypothetical protein